MRSHSSSLERDVTPDGDPTLEQSDPTCEMEPGAPATWSSPAARVTPTHGDARLAEDFQNEPLSGRQVLRGRYRIEAMIGIGGFSVVYRARDLRCEEGRMADAHVAIKVLRPELMRSAGAVERLKTEFRCTRLLSHPNILRVYDLDRDGDIWFQVMELLDGESLAAMLRGRSGPSATRGRELDILHGCAEALAAAHRQDIVHGDVKPGNIILTTSSGVRLIDFGSAADGGPQQQPQAGGTPVSRATPAYASPQVLAGQAPGPRDDVFSLACVAFELLAGSRPFGNLTAMEAQLRGMQPAEVEGLDAGTARALAAGLAWNREDRPATARQWIAMLGAGAQGAGEASASSQASVAAAPAPQRVVPAAPLAAGTVASRAAASPASQEPAPYQPGVAKATRFGWLAVAIMATLVATVFALRPAPMPSLPTRPAPATPQQQSPAPVANTANQDAVETPPALPPVPVAVAVVAETPPPARDEAGLVEPPQSFSFAAESLTASRAAPSAALRLRRDGATAGRADVFWRIEEATARVGRDFAGPVSGRLSFAEGQALSTLFIPLLNGADAAGDVNFSVEIYRVEGRAGVGDIPRVTVRIR
jgi:hypothetical protein